MWPSGTTGSSYYITCPTCNFLYVPTMGYPHVCTTRPSDPVLIKESIDAILMALLGIQKTLEQVATALAAPK